MSSIKNKIFVLICLLGFGGHYSEAFADGDPSLCVGQLSESQKADCEVMWMTLSSDSSCGKQLLDQIAKDYSDHGNPSLEKICPSYKVFNNDPTSRTMIWRNVVASAMQDKTFPRGPAASADCGCDNQDLKCRTQNTLAQLDERLKKQSAEVLSTSSSQAVASYCNGLPSGPAAPQPVVWAIDSGDWSTGHYLTLRSAENPTHGSQR